MGSLIQGLPVLQLSAGALLALVVLMILTDRLVTRRRLDDARTDRDHWQQAADDSLAMAAKLGISVEKLTASVERLTVSVETSNHALQEIQAAVTERRR